MQMNRLYEIVYLLLDRRVMTSDGLARHFGVSTRTILRDIEKLASAGVPLYTQRGKGGGISILEGFLLEETLEAEEEQSNRILQALQGLSAGGAYENKEVISRFQALFQKGHSDWIDVDFSRFGKDSGKFQTLKNAVIQHQEIAFSYAHPLSGGIVEKRACPLRLTYASSAWLLETRVRKTGKIESFEISRMRGIAATGKIFDELGSTAVGNAPAIVSETVRLRLLINKEAAWRAYSDFEAECIAECENGDLEASADAVNDPGLVSYLLSYGKSAKVLEPESVAYEIARQAELIAGAYGDLTFH
ncbi:MAG: WYL domain-containing protein [Eubacteriaceae bacterium]|jgi:predicted DNA-binding transcriptional regulator YafY|nr:WYL domain-containing protein [Eubacteriaceae bacterium]